MSMVFPGSGPHLKRFFEVIATKATFGCGLWTLDFGLPALSNPLRWRCGWNWLVNTSGSDPLLAVRPWPQFRANNVSSRGLTHGFIAPSCRPKSRFPQRKSMVLGKSLSGRV
jgi:hypothetical protein